MDLSPGQVLQKVVLVGGMRYQEETAEESMGIMCICRQGDYDMS